MISFINFFYLTLAVSGKSKEICRLHSPHQSGAPLENCWGLVDKTVCRTGKRQWQLYNGHKQVHDIQFQMIVCPNGMMANLYRPIEGHQHYSFMLAKCMPDQKFYIN